MTRKEAKEIFLNRGFIDGIYDGDKWREACIVISEWLEQEPILDKIRAEIAEYGSIWVEYTITDNSVSEIENLIEDVLEQAKEQVLQIIDKYQTQETHEKCTGNARKTHGKFTTGV